MTWAVGVDGCRGGWIAAARFGAEPPAIRVFSEFASLLGAWPEAVVGVDIPIGLPQSGARACDSMARARLGPRRASVFPAPLRPMLAAAGQGEASALRRQIEGKGYGIQAYNILAKVREVDLLLTPELQRRVFEVHPELSFWALNHERPLPYSKKTVAGRIERLALLVPSYPELPRFLQESRSGGAAADDLLDACAALWTAERISAGLAERLPELPESDARGLGLAIWY